MFKVNATKAEAMELLNSNEKVVINFYATWCGPCQMFGPVIEKVADDNEDVIIVKVDIDQEGEFAQEMGVQGVPTTHRYKNGQIEETLVGFQPADQFDTFVKK